ncbi:hypothetical protein GCM10010464_71010 [Pseudonocardia yunnanensis]|uniref:CDP-diacylglycerol diphosphatase n=1 Tax=Pseudonocardia yunnanensis TaxID=58107 RepID=A0ABW4EZA2_9PSEU
MSEDEAERLTRRRFIALSGAAGAGALLAGGPAENAWAQSLLADCGGLNDTDYLWVSAKECAAGTKKCLFTAKDYALVKGARTTGPTTNNNLLVPTARRQGIECPLIWQPQEWNYWKSAWEHALSGPTKVVNHANIGLGINSVAARQQKQLHIHIAGMQPVVQAELKKADASITTDPTKWDASRVTIQGVKYRVLRRNDLNANLFKLAVDNVAKNNMSEQTMLVTNRDAGGFYILNSQRGGNLMGTDACDPLLVKK